MSLFGLVNLRLTSSVEPTHERETHSSAGVTDQTARVCVCVCVCVRARCQAVLTFALVGAVGRGRFPRQLVVSGATLVTRQSAGVVLTVTL